METESPEKREPGVKAGFHENMALLKSFGNLHRINGRMLLLSASWAMVNGRLGKTLAN